ncbi:hypothetical protein AQUCO_00300821v1 [Aquilegia coerulea]|uniref:Uncharacterized protein n=1 Tax=Aquilegia coerulea TaxID=218851 RepID=A0A2G5F0P7_AQUCA|nr:hypothetical protein AQUCO_00300821v1 [Aquilegia coerulea]
MENLTEDERKAMRRSKFAPLSPLRPQSRLAHPGGPLATNKAAALAKFLERKLQEPDGLSSINPALIERAVKNAKETVTASGSSNSGRVIRHVASFNDPEVLSLTDAVDCGLLIFIDMSSLTSFFLFLLKLPDSADEEGKVQNKGNKPKKHKKKKNKKKAVDLD